MSPPEPHAAPPRRAFGSFVAVVARALGPGLVEVFFPWAEEPPARARASGAAPAPGDEVLVAFERGDVRAPYVIAAVASPEVRCPGEPRVIRTSTGHVIVIDERTRRLRIEDAVGKKLVEVRNATLDSLRFDGDDPSELRVECGEVEVADLERCTVRSASSPLVS